MRSPGCSLRPAAISSLGLSPDGTRALPGDDDGWLTSWEAAGPMW
jgi:hypothetical protein